MTKPIPVGAPRQRQARVCVSCRTTKVKCLGAETPEEEEGLAIKACERCTLHGIPCEFTKSRRMGRPRRLPKEGEVEDEDEKKEPVNGSSARPLPGTSSPSVLSPPSVLSEPSFYPTPTSFASPSASSTTSSSATSSLPVRYLQEIHPWLPLLPPSLPFILSYLEAGSASVNLSLAITTLLSAPTPIPITFETLHLERNVYDTQAALFFFYFLYGQAENELAGPFLDWIYETIQEKGWYVSGGMEKGVQGEMARRIYWESSIAEILFSVTSGVRDLKIQTLNPTTVVTEEDTSIFGQTTFPSKVRAVSLLRDLVDPSIKPTPQEYGVVVSIAQNLIADSERLFANSCFGLDLTGLTVDEQAAIQHTDEEAFASYLLASTALINILCSAASNASSGFLCGLDGTTSATKGFPLVAAMDSLTLGTQIVDARDIIQSTCANVFHFLKMALATPFARRPHSPFYGCLLMTAATGFIASLKGDGIPPTIAELSGGNSRSITNDNMTLCQAVLKAESTKWLAAARVYTAMEAVQVAFFCAPVTVESQQQANDLVTHFG